MSKTPGTQDNLPGLPAVRRSRDPVWMVILPLVAVQVVLLAVSSSRQAWDFSGTGRLLELGALSGMPAPAEWHRLITCCFLHLDWAQLASNMAGLLAFGWLGVRLFGLGQTALVYALAAPLSGLSVAWLTAPDQLVVGSSGCVIALAAFSLAGLLRQDLAAPIEPWRALLRAAGWAMFLLPAVFFVGNPAQLLGGLAGLLPGLFLPLAPLETVSGFRRRGRALGGIAAVLLILPWMWHLLTGAFG